MFNKYREIVYTSKFLTKAYTQNLLKRFRYEETLSKVLKKDKQQVQVRKSIYVNKKQDNSHINFAFTNLFQQFNKLLKILTFTGLMHV